jgi:hypothetical protein
MDLRKTVFVSLVKRRLHTILPSVLTVDLSARVTTLLALAAIGVKSMSFLANASSQKIGEQIASISETVDVRRGWSQELPYP